MSTVTPVAAAEAPAPKSFPARFVGIFVSPRETFADIARKPDFIAPLIVAAVIAAVVSEAMLAKIGMERIVRMQIEHSSRAASMSPEQMQQAVEQGARFGAIFVHAGFIFVPIILLIVAGVCLGVVNAIFGGTINFKTAFSVACYANLVTVLGSVIALAMIFAGDPDHFNPQSPMPTNPGFFMSSDSPKPLVSLGGSFDLFTLWLIALLGIGFSEATGRKVKATSIGFTIFGVWLVWVLAKMGLSLVG